MKPEYIPIFVISLVNANKRREHITKQMDKYKINYKFFDAVEGKHLSKNYLNKFKIKEGEYFLGRPMAKSELGCSFSHLKIYEKIVSENIKKAIILEDDVEINHKFLKVINNLDSFKFNWDLLYIGWSLQQDIKPFIGKKIYPIGMFNKNPIHLNENGEVHYAGYPTVRIERTHAYAITQNGALQLSKGIKNSPFLPLDVQMEYSQIKERLAIVPYIVRQLHDSNKIEQHIESERRSCQEQHFRRGEIGEDDEFSRYIISILSKILNSKIRNPVIEFWRRLWASCVFISSRKFPQRYLK